MRPKTNKTNKQKKQKLYEWKGKIILSLFKVNMSVNVGNPKESTKKERKNKLLEIIGNYSNITGYNINKVNWFLVSE